MANNKSQPLDKGLLKKFSYTITDLFDINQGESILPLPPNIEGDELKALTDMELPQFFADRRNHEINTVNRIVIGLSTEIKKNEKNTAKKKKTF